MLLQVENLRKSFGRRRAVDGVSFMLDAGEVVGVLGPNGAGKTTTMRMVAGYLEPDSGFVKVFGLDVAENRRRALERVGYLAEGAPLYDEMTPLTFLRFIGRARGVSDPRHAAIGAAIDKPIATLSKGYRRRVGLAAALISDPMLLVLDEPTDGLDPNQRQSVRALIRRLSKDRGMLISTHALEEVEAVCTRVIVVHHGKIVADQPPEELIAAFPDGLEGAFRELTKAEEGS
jgi:ABC-2 type transport system ATP-binding protein